MTESGGPLKSKEPIPRFASREEEASFWDSHDLSDYWIDFSPVELAVDEHLSTGLMIDLDPDALAELRQSAASHGIGADALARRWILERLSADRSRGATG